MKRVGVGITIILIISFCLSFFVNAEEKKTNQKPIEKVSVTSNLLNDRAISKANFFHKNINVVVIYK